MAPPAMSSPHLIRPYSAAQLGLVSGDETVVVFTVLGDRFSGPSVLVHVPTVRSRLEWLDSVVSTVVFVDEPVPDGATLSGIDDMLTVYADLDCDALARVVTSTEALKRVEHGHIVGAVDRSTVVAATCPEIVDRRRLESALSGDEVWANPTAELARSGGIVRFYEPSMRPIWMRDN